jgi:hypothetical protein
MQRQPVDRYDALILKAESWRAIGMIGTPAPVAEALGPAPDEQLMVALNPWQIRDDIRTLADDCLTRVVAELDLPRPEVRWFGRFLPELGDHANDEPFYAKAALRGTVDRGRPRELWVRASGDRREVVEAVAHEAFHLAQARAGLLDDPDAEQAALEYGWRVLAWYDDGGFGRGAAA